MATWLERYLAPLVGATILEVDDENGTPVLTLQCPGFSEPVCIWIYRDEECNGPGWIEGPPIPPQEEPR